MPTYNVAQDINLTLIISVEADSEEDAVEIIENAWLNDPKYVHGYLYQAEAVDQDIYPYDGYASGVVPFDELIKD